MNLIHLNEFLTRTMAGVNVAKEELDIESQRRIRWLEEKLKSVYCDINGDCPFCDKSFASPNATHYPHCSVFSMEDDLKPTPEDFE